MTAAVTAADLATGTWAIDPVHSSINFSVRHLVVSKDTDGRVTESSVVAVEGEDRVRELSRMLGGLADSESAGAHARELLGLTGRG